MAKSLLRLQARELRKSGKSVTFIAKSLFVSKSSASLWTKDIVLTEQQAQDLATNKLQGAALGRIKGSLKQKHEREKRFQMATESAVSRLPYITKDAFFVAGLCLYWAEGNKMRHKIEFCNSDRKLVQFMLVWFRTFFGITTNDLSCYVGINELHEYRDQTVKEYWRNITGIPLQQFTKTSYKRSVQQKKYKNETDHYGVLTVRIKRPSRILFQLIGLIERIREMNLPG